MADHSHTALIVVDSQVGALEKGYWGTNRSNPSYEENVSKLLAAFRAAPDAHIIHIIHESTNPASPLHPNKPSMMIHPPHKAFRSEISFSKSANSAFVEPALGTWLQDRQIWKIYFAGLSVDLCLGNTIRAASDLGVADHVEEDGILVKGDIVLIDDATAAWAKHGGKYDADTVHGVHVESLKGEFTRTASTDQVLEEISKGLNNRCSEISSTDTDRSRNIGLGGF
ncbi:Isochorismatase-like protein [Bisporella sp. PMI_857]|nr:Isochorismatase-like protein [Bisporella sp. PMI_857]